MLQRLSWCAPRVPANSPTSYYARRSFFFFFPSFLSLAIKCAPTFIKLRVAAGKCGLSSKSLKILARSCGVLRTIPRYIIRMSRTYTCDTLISREKRTATQPFYLFPFNFSPLALLFFSTSSFLFLVAQILFSALSKHFSAAKRYGV